VSVGAFAVFGREFPISLFLISRDQRRRARPLKGSRGGIGYQRNRPGLYGSKDNLKKRYPATKARRPTFRRASRSRVMRVLLSFPNKLN
jgi:hypothetical protein